MCLREDKLIKANIIVMGKTGAGKSTLINAVYGEKVAQTGSGAAVTTENKLYSKEIALSDKNQYCQLNLYDTVGLEIDSNITKITLESIEVQIQRAESDKGSEDIHLVWFCVNSRSNRLEKYEIDLIRKLSIKHEIPFVIVVTQCFSDEISDLEKEIAENLPDISLMRILAEDYSLRNGCVSSFGVQNLLNKSIADYRNLKINVIEKKLLMLDSKRQEKIKQVEQSGNAEIAISSSAAKKVGIIPGACIPIVSGIYFKMIAQLNKIAGLKFGKDAVDEIMSDLLTILVFSPVMAIPGFSIIAAEAYIETMGEYYLKILLNVLENLSDEDLLDDSLVKDRLKKELNNLKKGK